MFEGFSADTFKFFKQLKKNNNRDWFAENKPWYEEVVLFPAMELVADMQKPIEKKVSPCFTAVPKRSGGSIMRIYRDTRFSKDKTPYKTNLGIHFRHLQGKDVHAPGFYLHVTDDEVFMGAGIWRPANPGLSDIRAMIDDDPARWKRIVNSKAFKNAGFERQGDSLKRPPRGYDKEHPLLEDLKLKDHIAVRPIDRDLLMDEKLIAHLIKNMKTSMKFVSFLCEALQLPS